jgi:uncharacterized protein (TIGR02452 family)
VDLRPSMNNGEFSEEETTKRIAAQLDTLVDAGIKHAVLSAFGCGAFENPAAEVAAIYKSEIAKRSEFFEVIAFAIFDKGNKEGLDNFMPFFWSVTTTDGFGLICLRNRKKCSIAVFLHTL